MKVEIWSDVACPWCTIGRKRFSDALGRFAHAADVEVRWRSFELDPQAPREQPGDREERLAAKLGRSPEQVRAMHEQMEQLAAQDGLELHFSTTRDGNTVDAHRLLHLAWAEGGPALQGALKERLQRGLFSEGEPIGDPGTLRRLALDAGVSEAGVDRVLGSDEFLDAVRADEAEARDLGISGVPFFVLDRRYGISGAQPTETLLQALERAWAEGQDAGAVAGSGR